jgi:hypothetical protein
MTGQVEETWLSSCPLLHGQPTLPPCTPVGRAHPPPPPPTPTATCPLYRRSRVSTLLPVGRCWAALPWRLRCLLAPGVLMHKYAAQRFSLGHHVPIVCLNMCPDQHICRGVSSWTLHCTKWSECFCDLWNEAHWWKLTEEENLREAISNIYWQSSTLLSQPWKILQYIYVNTY